MVLPLDVLIQLAQVDADPDLAIALRGHHHGSAPISGLVNSIDKEVYSRSMKHVPCGLNQKKKNNYHVKMFIKFCVLVPKTKINNCKMYLKINSCLRKAILRLIA